MRSADLEEGQHLMADDKYDRALLKAELRGVSALTKKELFTLKQLLKEISARGKRARKLIDG